MIFKPTNMMIKSLFNSLHFNFTSKSRRQTTPNLFQNPILTKHGIIHPLSKSYDYNLPQDLPNRHLYWDRSIQNKARRVKYNSHRLQKLKIKPIHIDGKRIYERNSHQILHELSNIRLIKSSVNRTFVNLSEVLIRFRNQMAPEDLQIVISTIQDIHERFLYSLSLYHFSSFCQIRAMANLPCTEKIFVHFYKFIQQFSEMSQADQPVKKFKFNIFLKILKYVFGNKNALYIQNNQQMLFKNREMFKLFEDNDPRFISFEELLPHVYSRQEVTEYVNNEEVKKNLKYLKRIPGGQRLIVKLGLSSTNDQMPK